MKPATMSKALLLTGLSLSMASGLFGCSSSPKQPTAPAPSTPTAAAKVVAVPSTKAGFALRAFEEHTLPNGLRIIYVPDESLPYVSFSLMVRSGSSSDPTGQPGLAAFVAELLDKGTVKRSATQIADDLGKMGAEFDASASVDFSIVQLSSLSSYREQLLQNMIEIVMNPAFSDAEIERVRKQMVAAVEKRVDRPESFASTAFEQYLYESHPYAHAVTGDLRSLKAIKKKNIIQHYLRNFRPNNSLLAVVGKYTPEFAKKVDEAFGAWEARELRPVQYTAIPEIKGVQIRLIDKPGLVQAQIRMGHPGIKRQNEDFLALRVANTILGGAFSSRLNDRIRKELGLTYGIDSYFDARMDRGPFEITTFTKNETTGQAVSETLRLLAEYKDKGVTSTEVEMAKGYLKGIFPTAIETAEKLAFNLLILRNYGIPDSYLTNYLRDIDRLSASDVNSVIRKYVDDKNLKVVVYTNAADVLPQLQPIGLVEVKKASELQ